MNKIYCMALLIGASYLSACGGKTEEKKGEEKPATEQEKPADKPQDEKAKPEGEKAKEDDKKAPEKPKEQKVDDDVSEPEKK